MTTTPSPPTSDAQGTQKELTPIHPDVEAWVDGLYTTTFSRLARARWCPRWWEHPEAVTRLTALWLSWELAQARPGGLAEWLARVFDPINQRLIAEDGPFSACTKDRHTPATPWPVLPAPEDYW